MSAPAPTSPRSSGQSIGASVAVGVQLALAFAVIYFYALEGAAFASIFAICSGGWLIQHALPAYLRLGWFLVVAAVCMVAALGVADGFWVLAAGGGFVGLCLLPGGRNRRLVAVLAGALVLAGVRSHHSLAPWGAAAWPILSSLFLFRAISFLYDRHHEREAPRPALAAAYFFLPPNACFPVFPVVDFGALRRGYDPSAGAEVHQEGVERIVRGLIQLLAYRIVYHVAVVPIEDVADAGSAVQYLVTNVFLIVRIMAMFHVSIGLLHLFGFKLPPTTHLPFFAPGFSEFWRRANVYWRDFVVKIFFYPIYFRWKAHGRMQATALATSLTFVAAWFLHSYQWFWLRGNFPIRWQDGVYWAVFGLLVTANALWATSRGATRRSATKRASVGAELVRAGRIAGTFAGFSVLWSIWLTPGFDVWARMWGALASDGVGALIPIVGVFGGVGLLGVFWPDPTPVSRGYLAGREGWSDLSRPWRTPPAASAALVTLLVLVTPGVVGSTGTPIGMAVWAMTATGANDHDEARRTEGYYQELAEIPRLDKAEWRRNAERPADWVGWRSAGLYAKVDDARIYTFAPSKAITFKSKPFSTNSHGMRDQEYSLEKPPWVLRIAVLGASTVAGFGVADDETFEAVLEQRFAEDPSRPDTPPIEILNFAIPDYRAVRSLAQLELFAVRFQPDVVVMAAEMHSWKTGLKELASALRDGGDISPPELAALVDPCRGKDPEGMDPGEAKKLLSRCLRPYTSEMVEIVGGRMRELADEHGFELVWLQLPTISIRNSRDLDYVEELASAGVTRLDASDAYDGYPLGSLRVAPWDPHPNAVAHELIANRMYDLLSPLLPGVIQVGAGPATPR